MVIFTALQESMVKTRLSKSDRTIHIMKIYCLLSHPTLQQRLDIIPSQQNQIIIWASNFVVITLKDLYIIQRMSEEQAKKSPQKGQEKPQEPAEQKQQTITLPVSELLKWQNKSNELKTKVKALTTQNQTLKDELAQAKKKHEEKRKNDNVVQGLEQTIKQLQRILDENMTSINKTKKENSKLQDELNLTKQMLGSRETELVGLRQTSSDYFLLKQEVNRLENQVSNLKTGESQIQKLKQEVSECRFKIDGDEEKITEMENRLNRGNREIDELIKSKSELEETVGSLREQLGEYKKEKEVFDNRVKEYQMRIDDLEKENQLSMVKYVQQIKDLKELLMIQKSQKEKLQNEVKQKQEEVYESRRGDEDLENKDPQYLLTKIEELETQNAVAKYMMNQTSSRIALVEQKLKTRSEALLSLAKEYSVRWPNLEESDGLQYVDDEILRQATKDEMSWMQLVERCVIQNMRLKYMVGMIGSQYNNELRKKEFS